MDAPQTSPRPSITLLNWFQAMPFFLMHLAVIAAFFVPFHLSLLALCLGSYFIRMFAITDGYHRYFAHRSYKTNRAVQFLLAFLGGASVQKGALWWAANHRWHHKFSDMQEDVHSPIQRGFLWSHVGWILSDAHFPTKWVQIPDLAKYPELRFLNRFHLVPVLVYALGFYFFGGMPALVWGFVISTVLLWHGTFSINSLAHVWGKPRYQTTDQSRNNFWLALITLGEGWHNNHHTYMSSSRLGFYWYEIDLGYLALKAMRSLGLVHGLRQPPLGLLEEKRINMLNLQDP